MAPKIDLPKCPQCGCNDPLKIHKVPGPTIVKYTNRGPIPGVPIYCYDVECEKCGCRFYCEMSAGTPPPRY